MPKTRTVAQLRRELAAKMQQLGKLQKQRDGLAAKLNALDERIGALAGEPAAKPAKKKAAKKAKKRATRRKTAKKAVKKAPVGKAAKAPRRKVVKQASLVAFLAEAMRKAKGKMRAQELAAAVIKAGYVTRDKSFGITVAKTLGKSKQFKRVGYGLYVLAR